MGVHPRLQNSLLLPLALATIAASGFGQSYDLAADFSPVINDYAGVWSYYQPSWSTGASSGELLSNSGLIAIGSSEGLGMSNGWYESTNCSPTPGTFWHSTVGKQGNRIIASPGWTCCQGGCQERVSMVFRAPQDGTVRVELELIDADTTQAGCFGVDDTTSWDLTWAAWGESGTAPGTASGTLAPGGNTGLVQFDAIEVHTDDRYELRLGVGSGCSWNDAVDVRWTITYIAPPAEPFCFGDGAGNVCPCSNLGTPGGGCANSTTSRALLTSVGGSSLLADDLTMTVTQVPQGVPALLFSGNAPNNGGLGSWFGDGLLCAGGPILRHDVHFVDGAGSATWASGLAAANGWGVGDSRYFQAWYRDVPGPCTSGFNTSNGLQMTYVP